MLHLGRLHARTQRSRYSADQQLSCPLVDDLEILYTGIDMQATDNSTDFLTFALLLPSTHQRLTDLLSVFPLMLFPLFTVKIRAALLLITCDIPAARKVSGFTGWYYFIVYPALSTVVRDYW